MSAGRPLYEKGSDRENERGILAALTGAWSCGATKLPISYGLDYALLRGPMISALLEIKDRPKYSWQRLHDLGGYRLSLHKWCAAKQFCGTMNVPFILAVRASGEIRYFSASSGAGWGCDGFILAGRKDRGDWQDQEPHIVLNVARFRPLSGGKK